MNPITRNLAIIIGINAYQPQNGISPLKTAANDATKLASILQNRYQYQVQLLTDTDATLHQLQQLLATLKQGTIALPNQTIDIVESDRLLFYFAGHGIAVDELDNQGAPKGYLVPQDATQNQSTFLPMTDLHDALVELPCRHLLIFLDCCFAGSFRWAGTHRNSERSRQMYRERYDRFTNGIAQQVITSAAFDEKALDSIYRFGQREPTDTQQQYSPFAQLLFQLLEAKTDKNDDKFIDAILEDGIITATEIYAYLQGAIAQLTTGQTPGFCQLKKHDKGEYIFPLPGFQSNQLARAEVLTKSLNPYRGLEPYERHHHKLFFGRTKLREKLADFVTKQQLTVVLGASGSGKSSLVKAGLIPDLDKLEKKSWQILRPISPGERPFTSLNFALKDGGLPTVIQGENTENFHSEKLREIVLAWSRKNPDLKLLIVIDQFEELITRCRSDREQENFLQLLATTLQSEELSNQFRLVVTLRSDFEPQFGDTVLSPHWQQSKFKVTPMSREELREAIVEPATARVMFFESPQLVDELIDEVIDMPGALPLLSFTLSELYFKYLQGGRGDRTISETDYRDLGGVMLSLTKRGDMTCEELKEEGVRESTIRNVMLRMVATRGGELAGRPVTARELEYPEPENEDVGKIIKAFTDARLLVGDSSESESYVEPAHDELIRGWPKIKRWLDERTDAPVERRGGIKRLKEALFFGLKRDSNGRSNIELERPLKVNLPLQRELTTAANNWLEEKEKEGDKKAIGFLWDRDPRLPQLEEIRESEESWFNQVEEEFVGRSVRQRQINTVRVWSSVTTVISILSALTIFAWIQRGIALRRQRVTLAQQIAAQSEAVRTNQPQLSLLLAGVAPSVLKDGDPRVPTMEQALYNSLAFIGGRGLQKHSDRVLTAALSPNNRWLATGSDDSTVVLWDLEAKEPVKTATVLEASPDFVSIVSFSPDSRWLATAGGTQAEGFLHSNADTATLWDLKNKTDSSIPKTVLESHKSTVSAVAFSPNGLLLATGDGDGLVNVWNLTDLSQPPISLEGHQEMISALTFGSDNQKLATASRDGTANLWDLSSSQPTKPLKTRQGNSEGITAIGISPNLRWLVVAGAAGSDRNVEVLDFSSETFPDPIKTLPLTDSPTFGIVFSPDSRWFVTIPKGVSEFSSTQFRTARIWNLGDLSTLNQPFAVLPGHQGTIYRATFTPDSKKLVTVGADRTVHLWDLTNTDSITAPIILPAHDDSILAVAVNDRWLATGGQDNMVRIWNLAVPDFRAIPIVFDEPKQKVKNLQNTVRFVASSHDDRWLAAAGDGTDFYLWELGADGMKKSFWRLQHHNQRIRGIAFDKVKERLVIGSDDGSVTLWDLASRNFTEPIYTLACLAEDLSALAVSPNGSRVAIGSSDGTVCLYDPDNEDISQMIKLFYGHTSQISTISFSSDDRWLITSDDSGKAILWNLTASEPSQNFFELDKHEAKITSTAFSPDSHWVVTGSWDDRVILWDLTQSNPSVAWAEMGQHGENVNQVVISPDGRWLITASYDRIIRLWNLQKQAPSKYPPIELSAHRESVETLAVSADGDWLVSGDANGRILLWDLSSSDPSAIPPIDLPFSHEEDVVALTFSKNWIASGGYDETVRLWPLGLDPLMLDRLRKLAVSTAGRRLSAEERRNIIRGDLQTEQVTQ